MGGYFSAVLLLGDFIEVLVVKLLIYSHFFQPSVGGVESITLSLASGLAELRLADGRPEFEVVVVTETPAGNLNDRALPFLVFRRPTTVQLWRLVRACDVAHLAGPALVPLILCRIARKPTVIEHHGYQAICPNGLLVHKPDGCVCPGHFLQRHYRQCAKCLAHDSSPPRNWLKLLLAFPRYALARRAEANIAVSRYSLERCGLPRSSVIYHGIADPLPNYIPLEAATSDESKILFAYVGRLVSEKGISFLLQAASVLREEGYSFGIRLIGDGPERSNIESIIAQRSLQSHVRITGFLTSTALAEVIRSVHVVVMPSVWEETAGLAAIEQMMRGKLVIASDIGGLGEVLDDSGLKCQPGDVKALADAMRRVLQQPSIVGSLGQQARTRALGFFRRDSMITSHSQVYRGLVARSHAVSGASATTATCPDGQVEPPSQSMK